MYTIKLTSGRHLGMENMLRQTPGGKGISECGKYRFCIDDDFDTPDFWVVRNKYIKHKTTCTIAPENTILMLSEPRSVVAFPRHYCNQFATLCSCQENMHHHNTIYMPAALSWYVGINPATNRLTANNISYDTLKNSPFPQKTKLISVITSNKAHTQGHQDRIDFVRKLKQHYGDQIDVFGRGINDFDDKWDVLAPYKYHIAIENSSSKYYWTEKLSDCYLAGTFPIYYGCTNTNDYFAADAYRQIDIHNFEQAVKIIDTIIASNTYENSINALKKAKDLVLEDYNIFNVITKICDSLNPDLPKQRVTLRPAITILNPHNMYLNTIERNYFKLKMLFKNRNIK